MTWSVVSSRHVLRDPWISVRSEDCLTPSGHRIEPYYTLEYPDFVHVLALTPDQRIVLTRQYRHGFGGYVTELPGGVMERDETDPIAAGLRELEEETGFRAGRHELLATLSTDPAKLRNRTHLVLARNARPSGTIASDPSEEIEVVLVQPSDIIPAATQGDFANAAHLGLVLLGLAKLGLFTPGA